MIVVSLPCGLRFPFSIHFQLCPSCNITHAFHDGSSGTEPHFLFLFTKIFEQPRSLTQTDVPTGAAPLHSLSWAQRSEENTGYTLTCQSQEPWRRKELVLKVSRMIWSRRNTSRRAQRAPAKIATASREWRCWSSTASL